MISAERLRELLDYDKETGKLSWRVRRSQRVRAGDPAGNLNSKGYMVLMIDGAEFKAARAIWAMVTGEWPSRSMFVDHENRVRFDNRWTNLRLVSRLQNNQNRGRVARKGRSGATGVYPLASGRFKAMIGVDSKYIILGNFETVAEAAMVYEAARRKLHPTFHEGDPPC